MLSNVAVLDGQHLINGLALDPVPANGTLFSIFTSTVKNSQCNADAASISVLGQTCVRKLKCDVRLKCLRIATKGSAEVAGRTTLWQHYC